jgi:predicted transposase YdaD
MTDHDGLYHLLYAHPEMVTELLQGFVAEPWLAELDLARMERINARFHAESGVRRDSDIIWRIPMRDGRDAFLILFLEFQSTPDRFMALRLMVYVGLFWQLLLKEERVAPNGLLPPVFPIVIFNGDPRWTMPLSLTELIGLPSGSPIWPWQPEMRYHMIDEGAYAPADLAQRESLTALLFRLEHCRDIGELGRLLDALIAWFDRHPGLATLKSAFAMLAGRLIADSDTGIAMPEDLLEMKTMLATRFEEWKQQWRREGEAAGLLAGLVKGRVEGRAEGEAALLRRQLERRFGPLSPELQARIATAEPAELEEWGLRLLDAATAEEVLR